MTTLKRWRLKRGWGQEKLAEEIEAVAGRSVSSSLLARWERGEVMPTLPYAAAIVSLTKGRVSYSALIADGPADKRKERAQ
jgi:transcriptional regulator with XRE-family HTH domain